MHDLDWTQLETPESAFELSGGGELGELFSGETEGGDSSRELELAAELLEVRSDQELEQFLGKLLSTVAQGAQQIARSPVGRQLGGILKDAAKQALPVGGGAHALGDLLGLELEGLSQEDREFEVSRRVVQFARQAWRNLNAGPQAGPAWAIARAAATEAARQYAPGLVSALAAAPAGPTGSSPSRQLAAAPAPAFARAPGLGPASVFGGGGGPSSPRPSQLLAAGRGHWPTSGRWHRRGRQLIVELS